MMCADRSLLMESIKDVLGQGAVDIVSRLEAELALRLAEEAADVTPDLALARLRLAERRAEVITGLLPQRSARLIDRLLNVKIVTEARLSAYFEQTCFDDMVTDDSITTFDGSCLVQNVDANASSVDRNNCEEAALKALAGAGLPAPPVDKNNSGLLEIPSIYDLTGWILDAKINSLFALEEIQRKMVDLAFKFLDNEPEMVDLRESHVHKIRLLVDRFKVLADERAETVPPNGGALCSMGVELSSRVALFHWIAFALFLEQPAEGIRLSANFLLLSIQRSSSRWFCRTGRTKAPSSL